MSGRGHLHRPACYCCSSSLCCCVQHPAGSPGALLAERSLGLAVLLCCRAACWACSAEAAGQSGTSWQRRTSGAAVGMRLLVRTCSYVPVQARRPAQWMLRACALRSHHTTPHHHQTPPLPSAPSLPQWCGAAAPGAARGTQAHGPLAPVCLQGREALWGPPAHPQVGCCAILKKKSVVFYNFARVQNALGTTFTSTRAALRVFRCSLSVFWVLKEGSR